MGESNVFPVSTARNIGPWFDSHLDMGTRTTKTCSSAFYYLYNIRHIRKYLSKECTEKLVHAPVTSRVDYCNSVLYGAPKYQINKLQRVLKASARLVFCESKLPTNLEDNGRQVFLGRCTDPLEFFTFKDPKHFRY